MHFRSILILASFILSSCSIKEDRTDCPCCLEVVLSECTKAESLSLKVWAGDFQAEDEVNPVRERIVGRYVPRRILSIYAAGNGAYTANDKVLIQEGRQCDSVYAYLNAVDCRKEATKDTIVLHKQFATVSIGLKTEDGMLSPYDIRIRSNVAGTDLRSMTPVKGLFSFEPVQSGEMPGVFTARIPRLGDGELLVDIISEGDVIKTLDLGPELVESGFDWYSEDLDDIWISIDYAHCVEGIEILPWSRHDLGDYSI